MARWGVEELLNYLEAKQKNCGQRDSNSFPKLEFEYVTQQLNHPAIVILMKKWIRKDSTDIYKKLLSIILIMIIKKMTVKKHEF